MTRKILVGALFILPVLILLPDLADFPFLAGAAFSDLAVSHYPNGLFIQQSLEVWGSIPLWSPRILSGYPFAANPLSGLFYLPGWIALAFPLPLGFNLLAILHLIWGGLGMFSFLRAEGLEERAALLGALTFEAMPKLFSHLGAGHLTLLYAVCWTPWLLLTVTGLHIGKNKLLRDRTGALRWVLSGLILGLIALADVRWAAYAGLFWLAFSLRTFYQNHPKPSFAFFLQEWAGTRLTNGLFALLIAAPLLLPLAEYTRLSTRSLITADEMMILSMPPGQLLGLIYPTIAGMAEWMLYAGGVTLALTLYGLGVKRVRSCIRFWLALTGITLIFSLGSLLPGMELIAHLPGFNLLRVPPRVLFLTGFGFAVIAGYAAQDLLRIARKGVPERNRSGLLLVSVTMLVVLFAAGVIAMVNQDRIRMQFGWGAAVLLLATILIMLTRAGRLPAAAFTVLIFVLSLSDLNGVNRFSLEFRPPKEVLSEGRAAVDYMVTHANGQPFRVYSPSYSIPQQVGAWNRLEQADGVDPLQLSSYVNFMQSASGVPAGGYSVTLPPYPKNELTSENKDYIPNAEKLGLLNVRYVVSAFDLLDGPFKLLARFGDTRIYENPFALPRAWVQEADAAPGKQIISRLSPDVQPNRINLIAQGPGLLVFSEINYPGWQATVDGQTAEIETVDGILRGVHLSGGAHQVEFSFVPKTVYAGLILSALSCVAFLALLIRKRSVLNA